MNGTRQSMKSEHVLAPPLILRISPVRRENRTRATCIKIKSNKLNLYSYIFEIIWDEIELISSTKIRCADHWMTRLPSAGATTASRRWALKRGPGRLIVCARKRVRPQFFSNREVNTSQEAPWIVCVPRRRWPGTLINFFFNLISRRRSFTKG